MNICNFEGISLNVGTIRGCLSFDQVVEKCAPNGYTGISPSRSDLSELGLKNSAKILKSSGLAVTGLNPSELVAIGTPEKDRQFIENTKLGVDEAAEIGARCLIVVVGGLPECSMDMLGTKNRLLDLLDDVADHAKKCHVPLAIEPLHPVFAADRSVICDLTSAARLAGALGDGVGVIVDTYHVWWDERLHTEIDLLGSSKLLGFHVNDWLRKSPNRMDDRGMIGDGIIDIHAIAESMIASNYNGFLEIEILSSSLRELEPTIVMKKARRRLIKLFEQACPNSEKGTVDV